MTQALEPLHHVGDQAGISGSWFQPDVAIIVMVEVNPCTGISFSLSFDSAI